MPVELKNGMEVKTPDGLGKVKVVKNNVVSVNLDSGRIKSYAIDEIRVPLNHGIFASVEEYDTFLAEHRATMDKLHGLINKAEDLLADNEQDAGQKVLELVKFADQLIEAAGDSTDQILEIFPVVMRVISTIANSLGLKN